MSILREYIKGKLIEQASGGGSLIVVDIQPEYESGATFDIGDMLRAAAEYDEVLFLYNGADTLGMIDEGGLRNYYFEKLDYDEETFDELMSVSEFFDKGYGFFRDVMDSDICFDRSSVIKIVKYMIDNDIQDIRDLEEEAVNDIGVSELLFDDLEDYGFWVPELQDILPRWNGSDIAGGARNECLAEVEILAAAQGLSFNQVDQFIYEGDTRYTESVLTESMLFEGRYEAETTQISRAVVNWVKDIFAKGLPQDEVPKYKRGYPYHDIGIRMFDVPPSLKDQLNRLTATVKVDPDLGVMQDTFEVAGKAGTSMQGTKDLQVQIYLRSDFTLQDMNDFITDLKETIIHELEHTGQSEELKDTAEPHDGRGYDWNKLDGLRNYYSSQSEMEAYAKGAFKKAKVKGITYPEAIDDHINSTMETFIRRFKKFEDAAATDRLDYNEQDLRDYFQTELRDQILDIARLKYPKAHGLNESNVIAMGMCFPFAYKKAEEWFEKYYTKGRPGRSAKKHPDLNDKSKFKVVHGTVTDKWKKPPKPVVHGWVEMDNLVFDDQTKVMKPNGIDKEVYYDMYQPEVYKEFTAEEAILNCAMKGGEGPWDDDLYTMMQDRDAWMKESHIREYIRSIMTEDVARRQALAKDLEGAENWPTQTVRNHRRHQFIPREALPSGRILKKAFHKHADQSFTRSLTTVHWADNPESILALLKGSSKDEISTSAYLPGGLKNTGTGAYGAYGLEIKGHISLLANSMDAINTGSFRELEDEESHRTKSSGKNKGVKRTYIPGAYGNDKEAILVLDKSDWNPYGADDGITNNEALVDNWHPVAIVISHEDNYEDGDMEELEGFAEEYGLEIKRTKGMY